MCMKLIKKIMDNVHIFYVFALLYFVLGVWSPMRMVYINNTVMSYVNIIMFTVSNALINSALWVKGLL